ncbi:exophilin-5 isoform X2 [Dasypus novemcinctus]|nr:exophilin-5 isoform X1 [Dasypus novemcinctus]XP_058145237.1 exophilin-5 isoform X1 [Dasypus novemcinctus]
MLKTPLTYKLRNGMAKNDPRESETSRSQNLPNQKKPAPAPSRLNFRSSFTSLFSFRKTGKESFKLPSLGKKGCDGPAEPSVSIRRTATQAKRYSSPLENQPVSSVFVPKPAGMRQGGGVPPWDASLLENEFFQVLDDLDNKLAQEQSPSSANTTMPLNHGSRTQFSHFYSSGNRPSNIPGSHKNRYNETSNMSIYDILRPGTPREGFKTFSPRTRTIYDMYRTREPRVLKEDCLQNHTFGTSSLCFDGRQRSASPAAGHFTTRSLHFLATAHNRSGFMPQSYQQSPKRTPLSSIMWNRSDSFRDEQNQEKFLSGPSPMEVDPANQYRYPRGLQENRNYEFYRSQSIYQSVGFNAPVDGAMSPDPLDNSENMPFYHQDNPFARSFFSSTFGRSREWNFEQSSFWGQQEEHSSWSDFHQNSKPFASSGRDFEMISTEANGTSAVHGHRVPSQYWRPFSPGNGPQVYRGQAEPCASQSDFQTNTLESMEVSQGNGSPSPPHFSTPNVCTMTGSSYHIKPGGLECQQDTSPVEVHVNEDACSFGITQAHASTFKTSFSQMPDKKGNSQNSSSLNATVTLQEIIPSKPAYPPLKSHTDVIGTNSDSVDSPPFPESQPDILGTEVNDVKDLHESPSEKGKQLNKMDQTNTTGESPPPLSQDLGKNNRFVFNASTTVSSKRPPRDFSRISKVSISPRDKANELKKQKNVTGNRELGSAMSLSFIQESKTSPSFPSPTQHCHQELTESNEDISSIVKNNHWTSEPTNNEKPVILDPEGEQCTTTHSTTCQKSANNPSVLCSSSDLLSDALQDSSLSNSSLLDAVVIPYHKMFSRSPSGEDPSLGEKEGNVSKNQHNQFAVSPLENQKSDESHVPVHNEVVDVFKCHSSQPCRDGKGKGKSRHRISCIEKLGKTETRSTPTSDSRILAEVNQGDSKVLEPHMIYCTLPRKSPGFLIHGRKSEDNIMATSTRKGLCPFQMKNSVEDPTGKDTSNKFSPASPEFSEVVSDSIPIAPVAAERLANKKSIGSAAVRKEPLPLLIKRAASCPSGEADSSVGRDERKKGSVSDMDSSAPTPRPWERVVNPTDSESSVQDCSLTKSYHPKGYSQDCADKDSKIAAFGTFSLSNEHPLSFSSDMAGKESGKTLHKYKTTSTFSVSRDEDQVKCLEVVSVYYTLPRKPSKKFCSLLQKYTQNIDSLAESPKVGAGTFPNASEKARLNCSPQRPSGTPSSEGLSILAPSSQENSHGLSRTPESNTALQLPNGGLSEPTSQDTASAAADVSLYKGESKSREALPDDVAKATQGDSLSRRGRGKKLQHKTLHNSSMLQGKQVREGKSKHCQQPIKSGNDGSSRLPSRLGDNVENSRTVRCPGEGVGSGTAVTSPGSRKSPRRDVITETNSVLEAADDSSSESHFREGRGASKAVSDSESQIFALISTLDQLQLDEEMCSDKPDLANLQTEPKEIPQSSQEVNMTELRKAKEEMPESARDQVVLPKGRNENKPSLDDPEKGKNRSSVRHKSAAMSKANRKFPAKNLSPRRHVATIFLKNGSRSGIDGLSLGASEGNPPSPAPAPTSAENPGGSRLSHDGADVEKSEAALPVTGIPNRESSVPFGEQNSNLSISQPHRNEFKNISASPRKNENTKDVTVAPTLERESGMLAQPAFSSLGEANFSDPQRKLSLPFPLEPAWKCPTISIPLAGWQQRQRRSASPPGWEPELCLYRSKSLKSLRAQGDPLSQSHPPKARERHFSESTSVDEALSQLTLGNEFPRNHGHSQRFKSVSEFPSRDEKESWALYSDRTKTAPKSATATSRPIGYQIFGEEQQLAFLENVKRSLSQGRLWKPTFLKNPDFLTGAVISPPNTSESFSSSPPSRTMPRDSLFPKEPLKMCGEDPVDSDCGTDTTTDDEYYLDENDKESEL